MVLEAVRRRSDPLLQRFLKMTSGNKEGVPDDDLAATAATPGSLAVAQKVNLGYEEERRRRPRLLKKESSSQFPLKGDEKILLTWREIATGTLLLCAFGACTTVFVLLQQQDRSVETGDSLSTSVKECEARNALQQRLMEFMAGDVSTASALSLLADGVSVVTAAGGKSGDLDNSEAETCAYSVQVCPNHYTASNPDDETIMYVLLVGALLTVVGVTVLLYDDNEDAMLKMVSPVTRAVDPSLLVRRDSMRRASMSASERMWASEHRSKMGNADLFPNCSVLFADIVGTFWLYHCITCVMYVFACANLYLCVSACLCASGLLQGASFFSCLAFLKLTLALLLNFQ